MMNRIPILLLTPLLGLAIPAQGESFIRFGNGDQLSGTPISLSPDHILWQSPLIDRPVSFSTGKILDVTLPTQTPELKPIDHEAVITLTKEDLGGVIRGQLTEVTEDAVVIDTWFAGTMRFPLPMVKSVHIEPSIAVRFRGPTSLDGWKITPKPNAWIYSNFSFQSKASGSIARENALPDECSVAFDAEWKSDSASYKVVLFSDSATTNDPQSGYEFSIQRGGMILRNLRTQSYIGNANNHEISEGNRARIEIKASRRTGKIAWYVNDKLVDMWTDNDAGRGRFGDTLHFITHRSAALRISRIRIAEWDGTISEPLPPRMGMRRFAMGFDPDEGQPPPPKEKEPDNLMKLANGDSVDGKVKSIKQGKVTIETSLGELTLPVARLRTIMLPEAAREKARAENGDVRAWLADGGFLVFDFIAADEQTITGKSQTFGTATFRRDAFQRIEFDLHNYDLYHLRDQSGW